MSMFPAVRTLVFSLSLGISSAALAAPFAYVPNEKSGTISIIDTATDTVVGDMPAGTKPRGLAVSHDGKELYVSDQPNNELVIVDLEKRVPVGQIDLGESPEGVGISPDGKWIIAASEISNSISFIDGKTKKKVFSVKTQGKNPEHAVFSPDGKWVYVSAEEADSVDIIDVDKRTDVKAVTVGNRPRGIGFLPDGSRAYVASELASDGIRDRYQIPGSGREIKGWQFLQRRRSATRWPASFHFQRQGWNGVGDRHCDERDRGDGSGGQATLEHGRDAGRQEALRREWKIELGFGHRCRDQPAHERDPRRRYALGRRDPVRLAARHPRAVRPR